MKHNFEYFYTTTAMDSFLVEDIANVSLNFLNDLGQEWYINVSTELGETKITKYGPLLVDVNVLQDEFKFEYCKINYNEKRIISSIDKLLNDTKIAITQVVEIDRDQFNERLKGIIDGSNQ